MALGVEEGRKDGTDRVRETLLLEIDARRVALSRDGYG